MHWTRWIVIVLALITGGWMAFDGAHALVVGDYVTAGSGAYAGQLGPWSKAVEAVGLEARSTPVEIALVVYGLATVALAACFAAGQTWAWGGLLAAAILGLWYAPLGTLAGLLNLVLLLLPTLRPKRARESHA